ncbi:MAG: hypothetical protein MUC69_07740, partial [Gemmatimonadales bacterium]|nr:hypothetical protein [Gemmatimonadales bacterium]
MDPMRVPFRLAACALLAGCTPSSPVVSSAPAVPPATTQAAPRPAATPSSFRNPQYPSTYRRRPHPPVAIRDVAILPASGPEIARGTIVFSEGTIVALGTDVAVPADAVVVDGRGKFVTPGLIDSHSHLGVYPAPGIDAVSDGNEATQPVTADVWAEHSFWPQDPQIPLAIAGGVTVIQALPGSANLIGGRAATLRLVPARTVQEMKFPGAPYGLKMACGENPKRVYGDRGGPSTRMANVAGYRSAFARAERYRRNWDRFAAGADTTMPDRDLELETLAEVLRGRILVQNHCYRADEMAQMLDLAREFDFRIRSFHHAVEAYKIADLLARDSVASSIWADWWGFKLESLDGVPE